MRGAWLAGVSGFAYAALYPPFAWTPLSWVALVPLYLALQECRSPLRAASLAALWMFVGTACIVPWVVPTASGYFERPLALSVGFWLAIGPLCTSPYYAVAFAPLPRLAARLAPALRPLLFACLLVAAELARTRLGLRSPWALLGDAHAGSAWLRQLASLGGIYLVSAVVAWVNGALGEAWLARRHPSRALAMLLAPAAALGAALAFGALRGPAAAGSGDHLLLVQGNVDAELQWKRAGVREVFQRYGALTRDALIRRDAPPFLVVWPESALQVGVGHPTYRLVLERMSKRVPLLVGAPHAETEDGELRTFNSATLIRGELPRVRYDKRRLLPFSETSPFGGLLDLGRAGELEPEAFTAGKAPAVLQVGRQRAGVLICMEALYPELGRELAEQGATFLVNLSNDSWYRGHGAHRQHLEQVRFRAVETGLPVVRATTTGITAVIDPFGEVVATLPAGTTDVLDAELPMPLTSPLYARIGDAFGLACLSGWFLAVAAAFRRAHRPR
ncbi:MAG: apolipoprotein N-acyltransferase [Myxococcales bacterium]|nr:apolipoprotein N-acyltransferase [Myxococcales bacterium]